MEEKKLVPKRRFKGYERDWNIITLEEISQKVGDGLHGTPKYNDSGDVYFINGSNIFSGKINIYEDTKTVTKYEQSSDDLLLDNQTILLSVNGTIGNLAFYNGEEIMLGKSVAFIMLKSNEKQYIYYYLQTSNVNNYFLNSLTGSTIKNLGLKQIKETKVALPVIKEQQKIGAFFKVLDERIANQERKVAKVKALKNAYLTEMFPQEGETVPKRRFKGFEGEWNETILDSVLAYEQPTDYIVDEDSYDDSYDIPVLTAGQSFLLGYTNEKLGIKKADVNNSVIIFDDFTTSSHHVDFFFKVKSSALKILSSNSRKYSTYFAHLILKNIDYTPESHERHWISIFSNFEVMTPSMEEQQKIGEFFKNLDNQIRLEEKKLDKLQKMKEAYLEEMFV